jgi:tRNA-modifying protein YgfZ
MIERGAARRPSSLRKLRRMAIASPSVVRVDRGYVEVAGPDAADFLERMLSNEVANLEVGAARQALLLTPKGRIIAVLRAVRTAPQTFLLITDSADLAAPVARSLLASRFASRCEIEMRPWVGLLQLDGQPEAPAVPVRDFGVDAWEAWRDGPAEGADPHALEPLRIEAGTPAWGKELDDSVLPAEAGLDETHISFTKGCFPGQEPIARLRHRGHVNRRLRKLEVEAASEGDEIVWNDKVVGRVTSAIPGRALGYVRAEVPDDGVLLIGGEQAKMRPA